MSTVQDDILWQIKEIAKPKERELWQALHDLSAIWQLTKHCCGMNWEISQAGRDSVLWTGVTQDTRIWLVLPVGEVPKYDTGYLTPEEALEAAGGWNDWDMKTAADACHKIEQETGVVCDASDLHTIIEIARKAKLIESAYFQPHTGVPGDILEHEYRHEHGLLKPGECSKIK